QRVDEPHRTTAVALKDRLEARRQGSLAQAEDVDVGLTVLAGSAQDPAQPIAPEPTEVRPAVVKSAGSPASFAAAKNAVHALLVERHADDVDITDRAGVRSRIENVADEYIKGSGAAFNRLDYGYLIDALLDEVLGLGPLQPLLDDPAITEVMINHSRQVFVERSGRVMLSAVVFESDAQLRQVIDRVVSTVGRRVDESSPMCDARLRDGSRVNVVLPPLALEGPCMTIRKFSREK